MLKHVCVYVMTMRYAFKKRFNLEREELIILSSLKLFDI